MNTLLYFGVGNAKLYTDTVTFSLPAGYTCPGACECKTKSDPETGKLTAGVENKFYCYAAASEARRPSLRNSVWENFSKLHNTDKTLKSLENLVDLIARSLENIDANFRYVRIHVGGDFFNQTYFDAWLEVSKLFPKYIFYAYTKSIPFWLNRIPDIPENFRLTASWGSIFDHKIEYTGLRYARVCRTVEEAKSLNLPISPIHTPDEFAKSSGNQPFAILLHGNQRGKGIKADIEANNNYLKNEL